MFQFPEFASNTLCIQVQIPYSRYLETCCAVPYHPDLPGLFCPHAVASFGCCAADGAANDGRRPLACMGSPTQPSLWTNSVSAEQIFQVSKVGCPIRRSMDQSSFAAPHGLSQRITSFFACACQGIHQMPLRHLIVLIANAHQLVPAIPKGMQEQQGYLLQPRLLMMPSTCSIRSRIGATPSSSLVPDHKTSFSRLNPGPRG